MNQSHSNLSGLTKFELLLWISIFVVLLFILLPFYNTWINSESKDSESKDPASNDINRKFHFESWNAGTTDLNNTDD